eukprot:gene36074-43745_t
MGHTTWVAKNPVILPVFHHADLHQVGQLYKICSQRSIASISLRKDGSLEVLRALCEGKGKEMSHCECVFGASTISTPSQVKAVSSLGVGFLSTTHTNPSVLSAAHPLGLPVLCGVQSPQDCQQAIDLGAAALKVFPISQLGVAGLQTITSVNSARLPVCVSGGLRTSDISVYLSHGATVFALGFKLDEVTVEEAAQLLREADGELERACRALHAIPAS